MAGAKAEKPRIRATDGREEWGCYGGPSNIEVGENGRIFYVTFMSL